MKVHGVNQNKSAVSNIKQQKETLKEDNSQQNGLNTRDISMSQELKKEQIKDGINQLNETVQDLYKDSYKENLKFELHEESGRMMVKVIDGTNHEILKEIPPKEILDMLGKIREMVGILIDEKI